MTAPERRVAELEADVQRLRDTVAAIWRRLEAPGSRAPSALLPPMPRASEPPPAPPEQVVSAARAAKLLGLTTPTVRRLVRSGELRGEARRLPGRERRHWVVYVAGVRDFLRTTDR